MGGGTWRRGLPHQDQPCTVQSSEALGMEEPSPFNFRTSTQGFHSSWSPTPSLTWSPLEENQQHTHLLPLHSRPAGVTAVLSQCERLLHEAREGCIQVATMQAHSRGCSPLNGTAAPFPGISAAVSIDSLIPERQGQAQGDDWQRGFW